MARQSYTLLVPDTRDPSAVAGAIEQLHERMFPGVPAPYIRPIIKRVEGAFAGKYADYQAMDTAYHDLEHSLQATLCCLRIIEGRQRAGVKPPLQSKDFCVAFHGMLLHDIGYLKKRGDNEGTGAKFTPIHEQRGCDIARPFLTEEGWDPVDIERVCTLIICTGPRSNIGGTRFGNPVHRILGEAVCTADFLSQISDPAYVQKLPDLYAEFIESYEANHIPDEHRPFKRLDDLYRNTPSFWQTFVLPKLRKECEDIARYLADPYPDGPNPYLMQAEENMAAIRRIVAMSDGDIAQVGKHMG